MALVRVRGGSRTYVRDEEKVHALRAVELELRGGEFVALRGPSGSGKSTLLLVLAGWEHLDAGSVEVISEGTGRSPADLDWSFMAVVPQSLGLLDDLTAEENVTLPMRLAERSRDPDADGAYHRALLQSLDIERLRRSAANQLSLGEQQRVAVARALALGQRIVLADEPSTHQDADHGMAVFRALRAAADGGAVVLVATHDPDALPFADRVATMSDGELRPC